MKKLSLVLVLTMLLTLVLPGCNGSSKSEAQYNEEGQIVITVPDLIISATGTNRATMLRQKEFDKAYPNIKVNHVSPYAGDTAHMTEYLTTAFMGENAPTCMSVSSLIYINDLYNQGLIKDIAPFLGEDSSFYKSYDYVQKAFTRGESVIAYPSSMEIALLGFYNDSLEEAGYDPATFTCDTWDEYYEVVKKMNEGKRTGASLYLYEYFLWPHNWFLSNGATPATVYDDMTMSLDFASPQMTETLEFFRKLYQEGLTNSNVSSADLQSAMDLIYQKKCATFTFYPTWLGDLTSYGIQPSEITLMQFPMGPSATEKQSAAQLVGVVFNARKSDEEIQAAMTYIEFMCGVEADIANREFVKENEVVNFSLSVYEDIEYFDGMVELGIPQQWIDVTKEAIANANVCTYPSTGFTSYLITQIPSLTTDPNKDIKSILENAQRVAENEWLTDWNDIALNG